MNKCKTCPFKDGCYTDGAKTKSFSVTIMSNTHKEQDEFQNSEEFKLLAKDRYKIEAKNSEMKNRHGYEFSTYPGLLGVSIQAAITVFVVNMKKIVTLIDKK